MVHGAPLAVRVGNRPPSRRTDAAMFERFYEAAEAHCMG